MRLTIVRHAHSEGNELGLIQGGADFPLSKLGRAQASALAERLRSERFDAIYASDLTRARETAEAICAAHPNVRIAYDPRLRERAYGEYEGKSRSELHARGLTDEQIHGAPPGGETTSEFVERILSFLDELWERHTSESVLLVTHSGFITRLLLSLAKATDEEWDTYSSHNAAVSIIEFDLERNHELRLIDSIDHLAGIGRAQSLTDEK